LSLAASDATATACTAIAPTGTRAATAATTAATAATAATPCLQVELSAVEMSDSQHTTQRVYAGVCVTIAQNLLTQASFSVMPPATHSPAQVLVLFTTTNPIPADGWVTVQLPTG
jgi:hypothetical protein